MTSYVCLRRQMLAAGVSWLMCVLIFIEIACEYIPQFKMSDSLVTDKKIEIFTPTVIQSKLLIHKSCIKV